MASLSRQYRPQSFADVTDQESIKETLRLEVETGKLGNAYLFAGPRGVGKTTIARVFAKALNCTAQKKGEPCNACAACIQFAEGRSLDYIEMDAASNTGVDNVREAIIEHVRFAPNGNAYKIYTLDEAHMLSTSAWNALLKTIEEPPPYAKFIFITTELHKVPATIQSRCQRFDFKRVSQQAIAERIKTIASEEKVKIDDQVVALIAAKADGCVRDAETFLGQMFSLGETHITTDVASLVLPLSRLPIAARALQTWSERALGPSLSIVQKLDEQGVPLLSLFDDLIEGIRQLLLAADSPTWKQKLEAGDEGERAIATLVGKFDPRELSKIALVLMERRRDAKQGADVRFCMELAATAVALGILQSNQTEPSKINQQLSGPQQPNTPVVQKVEEFSSNNSTNNKTQLSTSTPKPILNAEASSSELPPVQGSSLSVKMEPIANGSSVTLTMVQSKWPAFLRGLEEQNPSLVFIMKLVHPLSVHENKLSLEFQYIFHRDKALNDLKNKRAIEAIFRSLLSAPDLTITGIIGTERASAAAVREENTVTSILKAFGGQIVEEGGAQV